MLRWRAIRAVICFSISTGSRLAAEEIVEDGGVEDDRLQVRARHLDLDVLVDEVEGLGAERVPDEPSGDVRRADRLVDVGQPAVVGLVLAQHGVRADRLPQLGHDAVGEAEGVLLRVVGDRGLGLDQALVAADGAVHAGEEGQCRVDRRAELGLEFLDVRDDLLDGGLVELERLGDVVEHAEVVDDQAVGLVRVDPVGAGDGLQEGVLLERLVQVLRVQDRGVEAGQQLRGDDDDLQRVGGVVEPRGDRFEVVPAGCPLRPLGRVVAGLAHHDRGRLGGQVLVELGLVGDAGGLVVDDDLGLEALRVDLRLEVLGDVGGDLPDRVLAP